MTRTVELTERQLVVLRWIGAGCPPQSWPDESHKITARALAGRGLVEVRRKKKQWTAVLTVRGVAAEQVGHYTTLAPLPGRAPKADLAPTVSSNRGAGFEPGETGVPQDFTARLMRRVANRSRPEQIRRSEREIREVVMRYKVVVTRVQVAERMVRATNEEDAAAKVQAEFDRPYGYFGSWKTTMSEIDVIEAERTTVIGPTSLSNEGPLLLSVKDAARALGISYSTLYQLMNQGDIEWVAMGSRKFLSREALHEFIKANSHKGYYVAR